jgi:NitT/TauT family transport system substrate-binding protein
MSDKTGIKKNVLTSINILLLITAAMMLITLSRSKKTQMINQTQGSSLGLAVEFVDHAAAAHIALEKGWFKAAGLNVKSCDSFVTGMALSAALVRNDIDAAYICAAPAICAFANGNIPVKIVTGTHLYGYGLVVDSSRVRSLKDLEDPSVKIACPRPGSPVDLFMNRLIREKGLNKEIILNRIKRMPPPKILMALQAKKIDAAFIPEQFPSMAASKGFTFLASAKDVWPDMPGSVLIVKQDLIKKRPGVVKKIVEITKKGLDLIRSNPVEASKITAQRLNAVSKNIFPSKLTPDLLKLNIKPEVIRRSLTEQMECTPAVDPAKIQEMIDYMAGLGYIKAFKAEEILDLSFLN